MPSKLAGIRHNKRLIAAAFLGLLTLLLLVWFVIVPAVYRWAMAIEDVVIPSARISLRDIGEGSPTAILIPGMACGKEDYRQLHESLAEHTRVVSYDRPGIGDSGHNQEPRTLDYMAKDLVDLLKAKQLPPPYILIGHSLGAHFSRYFAHHHPENIAGVVLLDYPHEDWFSYVRSSWSRDDANEYFEARRQIKDRAKGAAQEEQYAYEKNCDLVRDIRIDSDVPVLLITANYRRNFRKKPADREKDQETWAALQASLLEGVQDAKHIVDWELTHWLHMDKPEFVAEEIINFIEQLRETQRQNP